jgi:hypothetical protein
LDSDKISGFIMKNFGRPAPVVQWGHLNPFWATVFNFHWDFGQKVRNCYLTTIRLPQIYPFSGNLASEPGVYTILHTKYTCLIGITGKKPDVTLSVGKQIIFLH